MIIYFYDHNFFAVNIFLRLLLLFFSIFTPKGYVLAVLGLTVNAIETLYPRHQCPPQSLVARFSKLSR